MIVAIKRVEKNINPIPIDEWDTEQSPISDEDRIFRNIKGEIILPISEFFCNGQEESKQLDYFIMNPKRSYNSDETRNHICKYLNYFEKFYDDDKELLMIMYELKLQIDYFPNYSQKQLLKYSFI